MSESWDQADGIRLRRYRSYDEYREHQASKLGTLDLREYSAEFKKQLAGRLDKLPALPRGATILCLGARNGSECEVFIECGFFAIGVDLNPGPDNQTVLAGDFHQLQFADATVDMVYTNALDHVVDLDKVLAEIKRVLKPQGHLVAEIVRGSKDEFGREPGLFESAWWDHLDVVIDRIQRHEFRLAARTRFGYPWNGDQCVFARQTQSPMKDPSTLVRSTSADPQNDAKASSEEPAQPLDRAGRQPHENGSSYQPAMDAAEFFVRFGGSARTKNIRRSDAAYLTPHDWGSAKPVWHLPAASGLPAEFIRLCPWEMEFLYSVARRARTGILEIGRFNGGSTFLLSCAAPAIPISSIDSAPQDDALLKELFATHGVGQNVDLIGGDSQNAKYGSIGPIDLLFVDGDHSYDGCRADIRNWYDSVVPNGMMVFHDSYLNPLYGVQDAILDLLAERGDQLEVVVSPLIGSEPWRFPHGSMACLRKKG